MPFFSPMSREVYDIMVRLLASGLTQQRVADALGVTQSAIAHRVRVGWKDSKSNNRTTPETEATCVRLRAKGFNNTRIAEALGVSTNTVYWVFRRLRGGGVLP